MSRRDAMASIFAPCKQGHPLPDANGFVVTTREILAYLLYCKKDPALMLSFVSPKRGHTCTGVERVTHFIPPE